jgi:hypothetical protein
MKCVLAYVEVLAFALPNEPFGDQVGLCYVLCPLMAELTRRNTDAMPAEGDNSAAAMSRTPVSRMQQADMSPSVESFETTGPNLLTLLTKGECGVGLGCVSSPGGHRLSVRVLFFAEDCPIIVLFSQKPR